MSTSTSSSAAPVTAPLYGYDVIARRSARIITALFPPAAPRPGAKVERAPRLLEEFVVSFCFLHMRAASNQQNLNKSNLSNDTGLRVIPNQT